MAKKTEQKKVSKPWKPVLRHISSNGVVLTPNEVKALRKGH